MRSDRLISNSAHHPETAAAIGELLSATHRAARSPIVKSPKLSASAPMLARIALHFARGPARIAKFATFLNAKLDIPGLDEEQEQRLLEKSLGIALDAATAAIEGRPVLSLVSKRDIVREAVTFLRDHLDELDAAVDVPFVSDAMEAWAVEQLREAIDDRVLPWIDAAPALQ